MSVFEKLKGTAFEEQAKQSMQGELMGVKIYMAMEMLAREQGLTDAAAVFHEIAVQEAEHAGFYAVAIGEQKPDFWEMAKQIQKLEEMADEKLGEFADRIREAGITDVAEHVDFITKQENNHAIMLKELFEKHNV